MSHKSVLAVLVTLALSTGAGGCGMGSEPPAAAASATMLSGMPRCDAALLHPRLTVGAVAALPGKQIVYVDGVMACVDDAARVDQLVTQVEGQRR